MKVGHRQALNTKTPTGSPVGVFFIVKSFNFPTFADKLGRKWRYLPTTADNRLGTQIALLRLNYGNHGNQMVKKNSYTYDDLIQCGHGKLFGAGNAQLPLPPMLMFDRIALISEEGGAHGHGQIVAELDIKPDLWFFGCHFEGDPVMPGCLGLDAMWQLIGFYLGWLGGPGRGRALAAGEVKFSGQVLPSAKLVKYQIDLKRVIKRKLFMGIADAQLEVDGRVIYEAKDLRVGLFTSTEGF